MGGVSMVEQPSLERLKALGSLQDLRTQLAEANRLCNHPARADMVAKWLLDKVKKTPEVRANPEAWKLLASTIRLLSPERSAILLTSSSIIDTVLAATEEDQASELLLDSITSLFDLLLELSASPNGTSIKALLSLPSLQSARILAIWLRNAARKAALNSVAENSHDYSLRTGITIWSMRKHSSNENEHFASHCLAPAALLLGSLSAQDTTGTSSSKRLAGDGDKPRNDITRELETLLATHIFLPSRTAFYKAQSGSADATASLYTLLDPLKSANLDHQSHSKAIPSLLDIALRCVSTPTQRQRTKEKPWVEAVFRALHDCNGSNDRDSADLKNLVRMLQIVATRAALSQETLKKLVWDYSVLSISQDAEDWLGRCSVEHWMIIPQILKMESDIFTERTLAEAVFTCLSRAVKRDVAVLALASSHFTQVNIVDAEVKRWRTKWLEEILVPILRAFARRRDLQTFIELWSRQLEQESHDQAWSAWVEVDGHLHSELENSLTETQTVDMFESFASIVTQMPTRDASEKVASSIVILNGILGSFRSEVLANALAPRCEELFNHLLDLFNSPANVQAPSGFKLAKSRRVWSLLLRTFEVWFPVWIERRPQTDLMVKRHGRLLDHPVLMVALETVKERRPLVDDRAIPGKVMEAVDAECFVGSICHHLAPFEISLEPEPRERLKETLNSLVWQLDSCHSEALCLYPDLFELVQDPQDLKSRRAILSRYILLASSQEDGPTAVSTRKALRAIIATAVRYAQTGVLDDFVRIAADWIQGLRSCDTSILFGLLHEIPVGSLSRAQRESILNSLCQKSMEHSRPKRESVRKGLALMIKLMQVPNASSRLSIDHSVIWSIVLETTVADYVQSREDLQEQLHPEPSEPETLALIEELARLVVKHLLSTQDQERDRSTLLHLSDDAKTVLEFCCRQENIHERTTAVALSKAIIQELEVGCKETSKKQLSHRSPEMANVVLNSLCQTIQATIPQVEGGLLQFDMSKTASLYLLLDTLAVILELISPNTEEAASGLMNHMAKDMILAINTFYELDATLQKHSVSAFRSVLTRCFTTCSKYISLDTGLLLASFASKLVEMQPTPSEMSSVLAAFEGLINRLDSESRVRLTQHVFASLESAQPRTSLRLVQICLSQLGKDDVVEDGGSPPYHILPKLLKVARTSQDISNQERAVSCILIVLRQRPFLNNQHTVDTTLMSLPNFFGRSPSGPLNFLDVCRVMSALLLNHRARLQGRFHLVNSIYQKLISNLFTPHRESSTDRKIGKPLGPEHAHALSRAIILFCEPLLLRRQASATSLTDESRKEQAHVGRFVQNVLHHYCSQILSGTLVDGVNDALKPGLRSMIEAIEMNDADGIKHLSASMSNSERAVLRGVYDDWRRFGKWRGG